MGGGPGGLDAIWQFIKGLGGGGNVPQPGGAGLGATALAPGAPGAFPPPGGQPPQQGQQPGGMPPMPQPSALDNPALQALLAGYFDYIRSPRSQGIGGALGSAGVGALGQYAQARQAQYTPQLLAAQLGVQHSEITKNLAGAQLDAMKAGEPERNLTANAGTSQQLEAYASTLPGNEGPMLTAFAKSIRNDPTKSWGFGEAIKAFHDQAQAQQELSRGELFQFEGPTGELGKAHVSEAKGAAAASQAAAKKSGVEQQKLEGEIQQQPLDAAKKTADIFKTQADTLQAQANAAKTADERNELQARADETRGKIWDLDHSAASITKGYLTSGLSREQYIKQGRTGGGQSSRGASYDPAQAPKIVAKARSLDKNAHVVVHGDGSISVNVNGVDVPVDQFLGGP